MSAYYNENDPFAAAWLRELIKANLIAPGEVDERDIQQVRADDLRGFVQCHFFAGIGVWSWALRNAGWPDDLAVWTGSCPCQSFSASGKRDGFDDKRHLWPAWFGLIREYRPSTIFGEQVAKKDGAAWLDVVSADLESIEYAIGPTVFPACGVGAPHIRQRLYFVAHAESTNRRLSVPERESRQNILESRGSCEAGRLEHASGNRQYGGASLKSDEGREEARAAEQRYGLAGELGNSECSKGERFGESRGLADSETAEWRRTVSATNGGRRTPQTGRSSVADQLGNTDITRSQGRRGGATWK